ncbi:MAG: DNA replication and repair protein RecF [Deltaproteobacteria bacterium]|nr:DNA replication and repair protein RecF [Deltaproteobacteria bacterium]
MRLNLLRARGWRNLAPTVFRPGPRATVISGDNGQGKTNVVEAVYYLLAFRSFRTSTAADLWAWEAPGAKLEAELEGAGLQRLLQAEILPERRSFKLDGKTIRRDSPALAPFGMVLFVPEDLLLPKSPPSARRRFLDLAIFGQDRGYYREAATYAKLLKSRNVALKRGGNPTLLDSYDQQLGGAGARLVTRRRQVCARLLPRFQALFTEIHADLDATLAYRGHPSLADVHTESDLASAIESGLRERRDLDLRRGFTGYGPHADDLELGLKGHLAKDHGSQGQLRSLVLSLKLAELALLGETLGEAPLLLLDDVASELDGQRRRRLFETIAALDGQTLITVTDPEFLPQLPSRTDVRVDAGQLLLG